MNYSKEEVMDRVFLSVMEREGNEEYLSNIPHDIQGDYAVCPRFYYGDRSDDGSYEQSAAVSHELLLGLECDVDTLLSVARENSRNSLPGEIVDLSKQSVDDGDPALLFDDIDIPKAFALVNRKSYDGLSVLFYQPELVEDLSSYLEKDVMIFPVDKDVLYCVGVKNTDELESLASSYKEAADKFSELGEKMLSDHPIHYDRIKHSFHIVGGKELSLNDYASFAPPVNNRPVARHHR